VQAWKISGRILESRESHESPQRSQSNRRFHRRFQRVGRICPRSAYGFDETIKRLKADIVDKKIMLFDVIDQAKLASGAGIKLLPSTLIVFGNPPLGVQFLTSNPAAGLDWPVRLLVTEDAQGQVRAMYTDFAWIARRHGIENRAAQFKMASDVIASIAASVASK
jgi:uncharacterized protein (DUF302 family)